MRRPAHGPVLFSLVCACTTPRDGADESTGVDPSVGPSTSVAETTSITATTSASAPSTSDADTSTSLTATSTPDDSSDTEPHDDCALSESFDGPDGSAWPARWTSVGGVAVADIQGGRGRLLPTPGPYAVARVITPLDCTDVEVTFAFEFGDGSTQGVGLYVRQNGGYLTATTPLGEGYSMFVEAFRAPEGVAVWREIDGVEQMIQPIVAATVDPNVVYRARLRVTQQDAATTRLQARFWPDGSDEPAAWQVERTDGSPSLQGAAGNIAVDTYTSLMSGVAADLFIDDIVVTAAQ